MGTTEGESLSVASLQYGLEKISQNIINYAKEEKMEQEEIESLAPKKPRSREEISKKLSKEQKYKEALEKIRDTDFRGNRSTESRIAYKALKDEDTI